MDIENLSISSISDAALSNIQNQAQVIVANRAKDQPKIAGQIVQDAVQRTPEPGKGQKLNTVA